ncbi:ComF family protein [Comamonadaceae bacterium OH2545_COT-014]|nr:ComF family protein [Comamonadaceae bacterium OH2545_COT-014]
MNLARWLPSQCHICRAWPAQPVCDTCRACFAQPVARCRACALPLAGGAVLCGACLREPPPMDESLAAVDYGWPWSALLAQFKFRQQTGLAAALADLMRQAPGAAQALDAADAVLPVPASRQRLAARGYNPALLLARQLAPRRAVLADALLRLHDAPPQRTLNRRERLARVQGAFAAAPHHAAALSGRRLVLVDDVMTTGATVRAAASALRAAGAAHISVLVLARTV